MSVDSGADTMIFLHASNTSAASVDSMASIASARRSCSSKDTAGSLTPLVVARAGGANTVAKGTTDAPVVSADVLMDRTDLMTALLPGDWVPTRNHRA